MSSRLRRWQPTGMTADQDHAEETQMAEVTFGLFDWIDRDTAPLHQLYAERLQLLEAAEAAGFVGYHLAEHRATPLVYGPLPGAIFDGSSVAHAADSSGT